MSWILKIPCSSVFKVWKFFFLQDYRNSKLNRVKRLSLILITLTFSHKNMGTNVTLFISFDWHSLHTTPNSHYRAWSWKKKKRTKMTNVQGSWLERPHKITQTCLITIDLRPYGSKFKRKYSAGKKPQSLDVGGKKLLK